MHTIRIEIIPSALLRDRGLLESAMQRPQNAAYYEGVDVATQAALYMVGIALNHSFVDCNKCTGYVAGEATQSAMMQDCMNPVNLATPQKPLKTQETLERPS